MEDYVSKIDEACGEGREFIVTFKYSKRKEALKRVLEKCCGDQTISEVITKGRFKDKEVSIFRTGKLVIREFRGREEAESFLKELFK